jgi:predicted transposase YdaD
MLHLPIDDVKKTRFYQDVFSEGQEEASRTLIQRQLTRRCGALTAEQQAKIQTLSSEALGDLGEALLDFRSIADLDAWLQRA